MNDKQLDSITDDILDCFTCDEEMMSEEGVLRRRIREVLGKRFTIVNYFDRPVAMFNEITNIAKYSENLDKYGYYKDDADSINDLGTFMLIYNIDPSKITNILRISTSYYAFTCNSSECRIDFYKRQISWEDDDGDWNYGQSWSNNKTLLNQMRMRGL